MAVTVQAPAAPAGPVLETAVEGGTATGICTILGILDWRRSKLRAYRWFERGALIAILIGEFFSFYQYQVAAIFGLVWMIVQLGVIRSMIAQRSRTRRPVWKNRPMEVPDGSRQV